MSGTAGAVVGELARGSYYGPVDTEPWPDPGTRRRRHRSIWPKALALVLAATMAAGVLSMALVKKAPEDVQRATPLYLTHAPIAIDGDLAFTSANGVTGGTGTAADPYTIEGWSIDASAQTGILVGNTTLNFTIEAVSISGGHAANAGVVLFNVRNASVESAVVVGCAVGVAVFNSNRTAVDNCTVQTNQFEGILVTTSHNVSVENCVVLMNRNIGIAVLDSSYVSVDNNTMGYNNLTGVALEFTHHAIVEQNMVVNSSIGIVVTFSNRSVIENNTVTLSGTTGIMLTIDCHNNSVEMNTVKNTTGYGIIVIGNCKNNTLIMNNLMNNTLHPQAFDDSTFNRWNGTYPEGGNHWSDYVGIDAMSGPLQNVAGADGIGDTPYDLTPPLTAVDHYPLMAPVATGQVPHGFFVATQVGGIDSSSFQFNASLCWDPDDPVSALQVRWDFNGDGTWDTSFSSIKDAAHTYAVSGPTTVKLQVKDPAGNTATASMVVVPGTVVVPEFGSFVVPVLALIAVFFVLGAFKRRR